MAARERANKKRAKLESKKTTKEPPKEVIRNIKVFEDEEVKSENSGASEKKQLNSKAKATTKTSKESKFEKKSAIKRRRSGEPSNSKKKQRV